MNRKLLLVSLAVALSIPFAGTAQARKVVTTYDLRQAIEAAVADGTLDSSIKFFAKGHTRGEVVETFPEATSRRASANRRGDAAGCDRALRSALISFQQNAQRNGCNAVINLESIEGGDPARYNCVSGSFHSSVAIKGRAAIVK